MSWNVLEFPILSWNFLYNFLSRRVASGSYLKLEAEVKTDGSLNLCYAKLEFSLFICKTIETFLTKFQAQRPLAPFLYHEMVGLLRCFMSTVIESSIAEGKLTKIDLVKEENLKPSENIDIGFGAKSKMKKMSPAEILKFRRNCQRFFIAFCKKLLEKSCLKYPLTEMLSCFSPSAIVKESASLTKMTKLLEILHESRFINAETADIVKRQYTFFTRE